MTNFVGNTLRKSRRQYLLGLQCETAPDKPEQEDGGDLVGGGESSTDAPGGSHRVSEPDGFIVAEGEDPGPLTVESVLSW